MKSIWISKYIGNDAIPSDEHLSILKQKGFTRLYVAPGQIDALRGKGFELYQWISNYEGENEIVEADGYIIDVEVYPKRPNYAEIESIAEKVHNTLKPFEICIQVPWYFSFGFGFINKLLGMDYERLSKLSGTFYPMLYRHDSPGVQRYYEQIIRNLSKYAKITPILGLWNNDGQTKQDFASDVKRLPGDISVYVYQKERFNDLIQSM